MKSEDDRFNDGKRKAERDYQAEGTCLNNPYKRFTPEFWGSSVVANQKLGEELFGEH